MKNVNNFQTAKVQPQGVASHLLVFCQFQLGIAYKSVPYKKECIVLQFRVECYSHKNCCYGPCALPYHVVYNSFFLHISHYILMI